MAPYTMKINIEGGKSVSYICSARLEGDGYVTTTGRTVTALGSNNECASLEKGDGTDGLFIATLFSISGCSQNLLVWSSMSAPSAGGISVKVRFQEEAFLHMID